jgi:acetate kinase
MRILVLNCGSSSLKFQLVEAAGEDGGTCQLKGKTPVGGADKAQIQAADGRRWTELVTAKTTRDAVREVVAIIGRHSGAKPADLDAVGFRVVQGGGEFTGPTPLDSVSVARLATLSKLAPLHNGPALEAIREARAIWGEDLPMVAVFDTTFHHPLPEVARRYAIPDALAEKHGLWRHGFHGLAHRWMIERVAELAGRSPAKGRWITFQLGSGCSVAAVLNGKPVETSMGLTPLEGLMMSTRAGDLDPALPGLLEEFEGMDREQVSRCLNTQSGLLGVSGITGDVRKLVEAESQGDPRATLALALYCHRAKKYLGAYLAVLGGADGIVFGGGVGENQPEIRARICAAMAWCGLLIDDIRNAAALGQEMRISPDNAKIEVHVIPVNEEALIARDVMACLQPRRPPAESEKLYVQTHRG